MVATIDSMVRDQRLLGLMSAGLNNVVCDMYRTLERDNESQKFYFTTKKGYKAGVVVKKDSQGKAYHSVFVQKEENETKKIYWAKGTEPERVHVPGKPKENLKIRTSPDGFSVNYNGRESISGRLIKKGDNYFGCLNPHSRMRISQAFRSGKDLILYWSRLKHRATEKMFRFRDFYNQDRTTRIIPMDIRMRVPEMPLTQEQNEAILQKAILAYK